MMIVKTSALVEMDTDAISPDCLKAALDIAIDTLGTKAERASTGIDWGTIEFALRHDPDGETSKLVLRAETL